MARASKVTGYYPGRARYWAEFNNQVDEFKNLIGVSGGAGTLSVDNTHRNAGISETKVDWDGSTGHDHEDGSTGQGDRLGQSIITDRHLRWDEYGSKALWYVRGNTPGMIIRHGFWNARGEVSTVSGYANAESPFEFSGGVDDSGGSPYGEDDSTIECRDYQIFFSDAHPYAGASGSAGSDDGGSPFPEGSSPVVVITMVGMASDASYTDGVGFVETIADANWDGTDGPGDPALNTATPKWNFLVTVVTHEYFILRGYVRSLDSEKGRKVSKLYGVNWVAVYNPSLGVTL